jgi:hypothetical protein
MVAYRELDHEYFKSWSKKHSEAYLSLENRENKLSLVYEEIEKDLMVSVKKSGTDWGLAVGWGQPVGLSKGSWESTHAGCV